MDFIFCINDAYVPYVAVTIRSIIENNKTHSISIHVLTDFISKESETLLKAPLGSQASLQIYIVDDTPLQTLKATWSKYSWYRIFAADALPEKIKQALYLDADVIVADDIAEIFSLVDDFSVAGVLDTTTYLDEPYKRCNYSKEKQYLCAGVLMINLDYWRKYKVTEAILRYARENNDRIKFPDQDAINYVCQDSKIILPLRYGLINGHFIHEYFIENDPAQVREALLHPAIIHYAGRSPWIKEMATHIFQKQWDYFNNSMPVPIKKKHKFRGVKLIKYIAKRTLDKIGLYEYKPYWLASSITEASILQKCERYINMK